MRAPGVPSPACSSSCSSRSGRGPAPRRRPHRASHGTGRGGRLAPSTGLIVAEIVTGGTSASDEYVEITNAGPRPWTSPATRWPTSQLRRDRDPQGGLDGVVLLEPGRHVLLANALGHPRAVADATYWGGLAATGGAIVLRRAAARWSTPSAGATPRTGSSRGA